MDDFLAEWAVKGLVVLIILSIAYGCVSAISPSSAASFQCKNSNADKTIVNGFWGRLEYDCEDLRDE